MRSIKVLGLCLVAVFAFSAVAAASAMAEEKAPAFYECVKASKEGKKYTGKYSEKTCAKEASSTEQSEGKKNKYERVELGERGKGIKIEKGGSKATTITTHGVKGNAQVVVCTKDKVVGGELYNHNEAGKFEGTITFEKCEGNKSKSDVCGTDGTITYTPDASEVLWLGADETDPGLVSVGGMSFECGGEMVEIEGTLIGSIETSKGVNIVWKVSGGAQEDQTFLTEGSEYTEVHLSSAPSEAETTVEGKEETKVKDGPNKGAIGVG